ncbi:MAG: UDP-N-acetyl glucosamine 2-epimerase [Halobacteriota archaeon]
MRIAVFVGTRAELIGMASFLKEIDKNDNAELIFAHTGQHFDRGMYEDLLIDLGLREPDYSLSLGNMSYNTQISAMISQIDDILEKARPDFVFVQGNVISSFSAAIASSMRFVPVGHIESGYRSLRDLHSDVRRKVIEMCSTLFFPVCNTAYLNLLEECYDPDFIHYLGDPLIDSLLDYKPRALKAHSFDVYREGERQLAAFAVRLPWNIGNPEALGRIVKVAVNLDDYSVIMLLHPNTRNHLIKYGLMDKLESSEHIHLINPLPYTDFLRLMMDCNVLITDSGGPQKESAVLQTPCITLSDSTYYIETIENGWNRLVGKSPDPSVLTDAIRAAASGKTIDDPLYDGKSSERIVSKVIQLFEEGNLTISPQVSKTGFYTHLTCFSEGFMGMRTLAASQAEGTVQAMFDETGAITLDSTRAQIVRTFGPTNKI